MSRFARPSIDGHEGEVAEKKEGSEQRGARVADVESLRQAGGGADEPDSCKRTQRAATVNPEWPNSSLEIPRPTFRFPAKLN
jgi:hypothetical protein